MTSTIDHLSAHLAVEPGDLRYLAGLMVEPVTDDLADPIAAELRLILSPHGERTVLGLYWPGVGVGIVGEDGSEVPIVRRVGPR